MIVDLLKGSVMAIDTYNKVEEVNRNYFMQSIQLNTCEKEKCSGWF